jgi:hypothetical protein
MSCSQIGSLRAFVVAAPGSVQSCGYGRAQHPRPCTLTILFVGVRLRPRLVRVLLTDPRVRRKVVNPHGAAPILSQASRRASPCTTSRVLRASRRAIGAVRRLPSSEVPTLIRATRRHTRRSCGLCGLSMRTITVCGRSSHESRPSGTAAGLLSTPDPPTAGEPQQGVPDGAGRDNPADGGGGLCGQIGTNVDYEYDGIS